MGRLIKIESSSGPILVETTDVSESPSITNTTYGMQPAGSNGKVEKTLETMTSVLNPFCNSIISNMKKLQTPPNSANVEFGMSFSAEGNIFFAKASAEASVKITLNWTSL